MRRHGGRRPAKSRRHQTIRPKARAAPSKRTSAADWQEQLDCRTRERDEALEQQVTTAEVLQIISRSNFDLQTVFNTLVESAMRLCESDAATIWLPEGSVLKVAAQRGFSPEFEEFARQNPIVPGRDTVSGRVILEGRAIYVPDALADPDLGAQYRLPDRYRSAIGVPLLRDGKAIGVFVLTRSKMRSFSEKQIALVQNFAAQAVIAIANARLFNELRQSLQQQTATADVLKVISRSTFELQTVLNTLVKSAARLCEADVATMHRQEGINYRAIATYGPRADRDVSLSIPFEAGRGSIIGRTILERKPVQVADVLADSEYAFHEVQQKIGFRTVLGVPLLREGHPIGAIVLMRLSVQPFTDQQIELVTTFADQAVIAIENVRLFEAEQKRTRELSESLEQQTATSEVLRVISSSPGELAPVFKTILANAVALCGAELGNLFLYQGNDAFCVVEMHGASPTYAEAWRQNPVFFGTRPSALSASPSARNETGRADHRPRGGAGDCRARSPLHRSYGVRRRPHHATRPYAKKRRPGRSDRYLRARGQAIRRKANRAGAELRRPGRHRHREHAAAQRAAPADGGFERVPRAANRDIGSPESCQFVTRRSSTGIFCDARKCRSSMRRKLWQYLSLE